MKQRILSRAKIITSGPYTGWQLYGPYNRTKIKGYVEYYVLKKGDEKIHKNADELEADGFSLEPPINNKPFIDWIKWNG